MSEAGVEATDIIARLNKALQDRYEVLEEIGRGGMSTVYSAQDLQNDRQVAIKVLRPELAVAVGADRFKREIQIESRLQHPHILTLHDSGHAKGLLYYVMPLVKEDSLRDLMEREGQLPVDRALDIFRDVAGALAYAHENGVVHRDIKPENILMSSGRAMVADFGLATAMFSADRERMTESGIAVGTPVYMSPEQASGSLKIDARSDVYSLACVLFEMLAGEPPFTGHAPQVVLARHIHEDPPSLGIVRRGVPPQIEGAVNRALSKAPADRFQNVNEFLEALAAEATGPSGGLRLAWKHYASAAGVLVVLALASWGIMKRPGVPLMASKVAVFPLASRGLAPADSGAGLGVSYLIESALVYADPLTLIDVGGRLNEQQLGHPELISARYAREIARQRGAARYLRGVVQGHGDSTTVILRLYDVRGDSLLRQEAATGPAGTPLHHLGIDAVKGLLPTLVGLEVEVDLTALRERRPDAMLLWMLGERQYRSSRFQEAQEMYERALERDSALVFAAVKGAQAASWNHSADALRLVQLAVAEDSLLPTRYTYLARGLQGYLNGDADTAVAWLERAVGADVDWSEAYAALGEVYYHLLPTGVSLDSLAEDAFSEAVRVDSGFAPPLFHLAEIMLRKSDIRAANVLISQYEKAGPDAPLLSKLELSSQCIASPAEMDWRVPALADPTAVSRAGKSLSAGGLQLPCAEGAFRAVLGSARASEGERWGAFLGLQGMLVATGRDAEAVELIDSVAAAGRGAVMSLYVINTLAGADMRAGAERLDQYARSTFGDDYGQLPGTESHWVLGTWHAHLGNEERVAVVERALSLRAGQTGSPRDNMYAQALSADLSLLRGDTLRALEKFEHLRPTASGTDLAWKFGEALPVERLRLAEVLLQQQRYEEGYRRAAVFDHAQPIVFLAYLPRSLVLRCAAARAMSDVALEKSCRERLSALGRTDLLDVEEHSQTGGR